MFTLFGQGAGQTQQQSTTQATPAAGADQTQQQQQQQQQQEADAGTQQQTQQQTQQAAPDTARSLDLYQMLTGTAQQQQAQQNGQNGAAQQPDTAALVGQMMQALMQTQQEDSLTGAPSINAEKLTAIIPTLGMETGIDFTKIAQQMNNGEAPQALQALVTATQANTLRGFVPIVNELIRHAVQAAQNGAVTTSHQGLLSSAIVSEFQQRYAYGASPAISPLIAQFANSVAKSAPRGANPGALADKLHEALQVLGGSMQLTPTQTQQRNGIQTNFADLFKE